MQKRKYNCDKIKDASKKQTNDIFIRYKTPILDGAIKIINEFKKDKEDGVHYKNLCEELNKYAKVQRRCFREEITNQGYTYKSQEWNKIVNALYITFNSNSIKRLCYLEKDKEETTKKYVLDIHEAFRDFCIEKKPKETNSTLSFEECMQYLEWIKRKKEIFQGLDPGYSYIRDYSDYFNIRNKCNYSWLIDNKPDMVCIRNTKTKPKEQDDLAKTSVETSQSTPDVAQAIPAGDTKVNPASEKPSSQGDVNIDRPKPSNSNPKVPDKSAPTPDANVSSNVNTVAQFPDMNITGIDISKSGHYIHVQRTEISRNPSNLYNIIRSSIPIQKQFQEPIVPFAKYSLILEHRDPPISHFDDALPPFSIITSGNKKLDRVVLEPAIPDASYFRSPSMIYTLVFLAVFTVISTFYLFSKYTPFGLLFSKKKKKKRLKRQLEIKKIPEESPIFDKITNYSVNDMPYENKTHNDNNMYSKIKIQKGLLNKNISLPKEKKNKRKALIDIHMELLNEYKNDEWELNKNDFLQICLEEFIREQNKIYSNSKNTNLVMKNISIQNTEEDKMALLDKWTERYRSIWEKFKSENAFKVLQYEWKKEEKEYLEKVEQFENNILNENTKISYKEIKKEIWRKWIKKQAKFIEQFTQEKWFKSLVKQIKDVSDEYKMGEIKYDIFVLNIEKLDNINNNQESYKHDNNPFLIKVLTQIFMMIIEECIKEESPEKTELVLDNIISKINKEKCQNIKSCHVENTYEKSKDHLEYNEMLDKDTHKYKDSFKELMEGWTNNPDIDINTTDDKNKSDKSVEMTYKNFLNPNENTSENTINYIRKE
ncbi:STP1 protein [Plasmodium ovale curtisi]|uniref:STP1 protein n=1 Tax=Plasmodium ovale curtisi TaxID=864141 RepID=A0A1A8X7H8_PLAOA|nr:STP1 protein [Plasmodium ovale curtisi]